MAKRRKKEKRVEAIDEMATLKRDLTNTVIWMGISVLAVGILALLQAQFSILS